MSDIVSHVEQKKDDGALCAVCGCTATTMDDGGVPICDECFAAVRDDCWDCGIDDSGGLLLHNLVDDEEAV